MTERSLSLSFSLLAFERVPLLRQRGGGGRGGGGDGGDGGSGGGGRGGGGGGIRDGSELVLSIG